MLLSNLLTNAAIREEIRYLSWLEPLMNLVQSNDSQSAQQALRCVVNVTFDGKLSLSTGLIICSPLPLHVGKIGRREQD